MSVTTLRTSLFPPCCTQKTAEIVHFVQLCAWVVRCSYRKPLTKGTTCSFRHVHDLTFARPFAHTNRDMYSFFPNRISLWNNLPSSVVHSGTFKHSISFCWMYARISSICYSCIPCNIAENKTCTIVLI